MDRKEQVKSGIEIKTRLLHMGLSIADVGRQIRRPRTTVSQAIHHPHRFPRVRKQLIDTLWTSHK